MLLWVDLETTGLDERCGAILEIAALLTDDQFENVVEGPSLVVDPSFVGWQDMMDPYVREMHTKNGLIADIAAGKGVRMHEAEMQVRAFVEDHAQRVKGVGPEGWTPLHQVPLAGSSVHFDRRFMRHHTPEFERALNYRCFDVSTLKLACQAFAPHLAASRKRSENIAHRAMADIKESLAEARFYRDVFLRRG
jgi:oligoribonuclease